MINRDVIRELVEAFLKESNNYLVDIIVNQGNSIMVEIDNDEGVGINDCEALSRYIESNLDRQIEDFELTISSTGLTSPFKTTRQYKKYIGKEIETLTKKGEKLKGTLKEADDTGFTLTTTKRIRNEGEKHKIEVSENIRLSYEETKYTKYLISFK